MSTSDPLRTYRGVAEQLGVSYATVRRYAASGQLAVVRLNGQTVRIKQSAIDAFVARHEEPTIHDAPRRRGAA